MVGPACPGNDYVHMVKVKGDTIRVNPIKVKFSVEKQYWTVWILKIIFTDWFKTMPLENYY